jgi:hypothetical protein
MRCSVSACFFQEGRDSFEKQRSFAVGLDNLYRASTLSSCIAQCDAESANICGVVSGASAETHTSRKWVSEFELREKERVRDLVLACVLFCLGHVPRKKHVPKIHSEIFINEHTHTKLSN